MDVVIATEDDLSEVVLKKVICEVSREYRVHTSLGKTGFGYLKQRISNFNKMADHMPVIVLADLDRALSRDALFESWLPGVKSERLIFSVAVREIESWVLADAESFSEFFGVSKALIPRDPDRLEKAKLKLLEIVARSTKRSIRDEILPRKGSSSPVGLGYNDHLCRYISSVWGLKRASDSSQSLSFTVGQLERLRELID